jgi:hypothetical protein
VSNIRGSKRTIKNLGSALSQKAPAVCQSLNTYLTPLDGTWSFNIPTTLLDSFKHLLCFAKHLLCFPNTYCDFSGALD